MGDESGQPGGADPDNRRMMDFNLSSEGLELLNFTSELAQLRLDNVALRRGSYSTYHVSENLLVFEMTFGNDSNMVVLNRGHVDQLEIPYDEVIFGDATLFDDALAISANSVTVLRHSSASDASGLPRLASQVFSSLMGHDLRPRNWLRSLSRHQQPWLLEISGTHHKNRLLQMSSCFWVGSQAPRFLERGDGHLPQILDCSQGRKMLDL